MRTFLIALVVIALPITAHAEVRDAEVVERVVAVVDGDAVWLSELQRFLMLRTGGELVSDDDAVLRRALDALIELRLVEHAAEEQGIVVADAQVDAAIESVRRMSGLERGDFEAVRAAGYTWAAYREDIRRQIAYMILVRSRVVLEGTASAQSMMLESAQRELAAELRRSASVEVRL